MLKSVSLIKKVCYSHYNNIVYCNKPTKYWPFYMGGYGFRGSLYVKKKNKEKEEIILSKNKMT